MEAETAVAARQDTAGTVGVIAEWRTIRLNYGWNMILASSAFIRELHQFV